MEDYSNRSGLFVDEGADEFWDKTTAPNQLWQADFEYFKITGWGWFYLSTVIDAFSRYVIAWTLRTMMKASADRTLIRYRSKHPAKIELRERLRSLANERRRLATLVCSSC
jgi:hypothetical protein